MDGYCAGASVPIRGHFFASSGDQHANHRFNAAAQVFFCPQPSAGETCSASAASGDDNSIFSARLTGLTEISAQISPSWVNIWHSGGRAGGKGDITSVRRNFRRAIRTFDL